MTIPTIVTTTAATRVRNMLVLLSPACVLLIRPSVCDEGIVAATSRLSNKWAGGLAHLENATHVSGSCFLKMTGEEAGKAAMGGSLRATMTILTVLAAVVVGAVSAPGSSAAAYSMERGNLALRLTIKNQQVIKWRAGYTYHCFRYDTTTSEEIISSKQSRPHPKVNSNDRFRISKSIFGPFVMVGTVTKRRIVGKLRSAPYNPDSYCSTGTRKDPWLRFSAKRE